MRRIKNVVAIFAVVFGMMVFGGNAVAQVGTSGYCCVLQSPPISIKMGQDATVSTTLWQNVGGNQGVTGLGAGNMSFQSQGMSFVQNATTNLNVGSAVNASGATSSGPGGSANAAFNVNSSAGGFGGSIAPSINFGPGFSYYDPGWKGVTVFTNKTVDATASSNGPGSAAITVRADTFANGTFTAPTFYGPVFYSPVFTSY